MAISDMLNRRVRARPAEHDDVYSEQSDAAEEVSQDEGEDGGSDADADDLQSQDQSEDSDVSGDDASEEGENSAADEEELSDEGDDDIKASLSNISFGALAKAQASMGPKKRKEKPTKTEDAASPLDDIRARILEARERKRLAAGNSDSKEKKAARSNKHAPMEQSSRRAVSRKRTIVEPPAHAKPRDPRFDAAVMGHNGGGKNPELANKAYAFLDEYRASELKELKAELAKTKNPEQKEALKKQIRSVSDRMRSIENKKREMSVQAEHKQKEKQLLREGKKSTPYFLKKSDLKKQVMQKKYEDMGSRDRAKALERRRKKMASKERKEMPWERRGVEDSGFAGGNPGKRRRLH